ncbi:MAG: methylmalonyl-CoA epimerase [Candidatus Marinimicrobia bacterium]|mgnify:FL=1|nr:methylmalonyl-CoA epimerase [Candidatus Neomarinimicrobiota bacterium]|tara:strand:- start:4182 stop:4574 length:393 start_codon:yes stop_codon:yes gene_type:complete
MKLHHIGIVVKNIQESIGELTKFLEFKETSIPMGVKSQQVNVCFLKTSDVFVELIEPIDNDSPVKKFSESGGGFHHLCFEVEDITKELEKMTNGGARIIVEPTKGFDNRIIAFVLLNMKNTNCNLIELVE